MVQAPVTEVFESLPPMSAKSSKNPFAYGSSWTREMVQAPVTEVFESLPPMSAKSSKNPFAYGRVSVPTTSWHPTTEPSFIE